MDNNFNNETFNYTPQPEQPQKDPGHGLAIASLVLGILSILSCCCTYLAIILGVVGIVLAIISLAGKMETMATVGMILSILGVVIAVGMIIWSAAFAQSPAYQEIMNQYMDMYGSY